jgi:hypothetical protein
MALDQLAEGRRVAGANLLDELAIIHPRYRRLEDRHCWAG